MSKYILKRILTAVATVFILTTVTFILVKLIPGDPFVNDKVPAAIQEKQRAYYGLDKPIIEQYFIYLDNLVHGDLGTSLTKTGKSVISIIGEMFPVSAKLGVIAYVFAVLTGILFGILCAHFKNKWPDYLLMIIAILGIALPSMVLGPLLRYYLAVKTGLFAVAGWGTPKQIILPAFVLGMGTIASTTRMMRASMLNIIPQDYIKTARSKGLRPGQIVLRHQLRNALVPILTNMGIVLAGILMGSFVVESIFLIPGMGKYFVNSITTLDYPMIMGMTIFYGTLLVSLNLVVDIVLGFVDPRIRVK